MTDHDRALALAERIAEAWGLLSTEDTMMPFRRIWGGPWTKRVIVLGGMVVIVLSPSVNMTFYNDGDFAMSVGPPLIDDAARDHLRLADAATDGLIADRLRRAGLIDWLDLLFPPGKATPDESA